MNQVESQPLPIGEQIGVYEIKSLKHIGQTAILYHVKNKHMNAMEILAEYFPCKIVRRTQNGKTVESLFESQQAIFDLGLERFLEQAERLSEIVHPNIARVYNTLQLNGTGYVVMDNEKGTPLIKLLKASTTFSQTELQYLLTTLLDGIQQTHEKAIVHGDIHPANILIKNNGEPKLIDFIGNRLATALDYGNPEKYLHLSYAAPELFDRGYSPKPTADVYALGATLYRCITHTNPLPPAERLSAITKSGTDPVQTAIEVVAINYSEKFLTTVLKMLELSENKRLPTVGSVLLALGVRDPESTASELSESSQSIQQPDHIQDTWRSSRNLWLGFALLILLSFFGIWSSIKDDRQSALKTNASRQQVSKTTSSEKPIVSPIPELPKNDAEIPMPKPLESDVSLTPPEKRLSKTNTISAGEANAQVNEPSLLPEQSAEMTDQPQTQVESFDESNLINEAMKPPSRKNDEKQAEIKDHLAAAEAALMAFHLTTPADDNAYAHYRAVLELDPENSAAIEGIQQIVDRYARMIDRAINMKSYHNARVYLKRAKEIKPNDKTLEKLGKALQ